MKRHATLVALASLLLAAGCADNSSAPEGGEPASDEPELKAGQASLVVPLIDEKKRLLSRYNAQAKAKGLKELPDTFEVRTQGEGTKLSELRDYFAEKTMPAVGAQTQPMPAWGPDSFTNWSKKNKVPGLCYRGNPTKVVETIGNLTDSVFSDQLVIHGWKYKKKEVLSDGVEEYVADFPEVWHDWRGEGTSVLVVFSQSDDGDNLTPAIIPRCR